MEYVAPILFVVCTCVTKLLVTEIAARQHQQGSSNPLPAVPVPISSAAGALPSSSLTSRVIIIIIIIIILTSSTSTSSLVSEG